MQESDGMSSYFQGFGACIQLFTQRVDRNISIDRKYHTYNEFVSVIT
jgi:hypothetical protein